MILSFSTVIFCITYGTIFEHLAIKLFEHGYTQTGTWSGLNNDARPIARAGNSYKRNIRGMLPVRQLANSKTLDTRNETQSMSTQPS